MNVTVLCDASYCPDMRLAGYGYWIACQRGKRGGSGRIESHVGDVNSAEMMAICNTIWHGVNNGLIERGDILLIQTDSLASIDRLEGKREVKVTEQQQTIIAYFEKIVRRLDIGYSFRHVKAHTNLDAPRYRANRMCDLRARKEMLEARRLQTIRNNMTTIRGLLHEV